MLGFDPVAYSSIAALPEAEAMLVTSVSSVTWQFLVDWDTDGAFSGYDDITPYVQQAEWKTGFSRALQLTADESTARLTLRNDDRRFSPEYSGGTYYGKLVPHKFMQIRSVSPEAGTVIQWTGWVDVIAPLPLEIGEQRCTIEAKGPKHFYDDSVVHLDIFQDARADEIIPEIIKEVILPPSTSKAWRLGMTHFAELGTNTVLPDFGYFYTLEEGRSTYPYAGDAWVDENATNEIYDCVAGEPGRFFFHRDGRAIFWNRHHLAAKTQNDGTVSIITQAGYDYGRDIYNVAQVKNYPRTVGSGDNDTLWQLEDELIIQPGKERKIRASYTDSDSKNRIGATDVQMPTVADGTLAYTPANKTIFIDMTVNGDSTEIRIQNDNAVAVTITTLVLKGRKITTFEAQTFEARDADSIRDYGMRTLVIDTKMMANDLLANSIAAHEVALRKDPRGMMKSVQVRVKDDTTRALAIGAEVGTRLRVADTQVAHDADYFVIGEQHRLAEGFRHDVTWYLEKADRQARWKLNTSTLGTDTVLSI